MSKPRGIVIAGNWKMNSIPQETQQFFTTLKSKVHEFIDPSFEDQFEKGKIQAVLCPPFLSLERSLALAAHLPFPIRIAAQNAHYEAKGAFTGEISGTMLDAIGINTCLVGHSERRQYFGETDESVQKKTKSLLNQGFQVILCMGESQQERESGKTHEVLARQIEIALARTDAQMIQKALGENLMIAYEPIWAIGTGLTATPEQAQEAHHFIRNQIKTHFGALKAGSSILLYGGSVTPENIDSLLACPDVDGALVGGASLKPESFLALLRSGCSALI